MSFEDELRNRLQAGVSGTEVDTRMLTNGGLARGVRGVRRRRFGQIVAAGAALTVLGSAAAYASWFTGAPTQVAGPPAVTATTTTATTPQAALRILLDLLPAQATTGDYAGGKDPDGKSPGTGVWGVLTYADRTELSLHLGERQARATCASAERGVDCRQERLDDGSVLTTVRIPAPDRSRDIAWRSTLDRRDGAQIVLMQDYDHEVKGDGIPPLPVEAMRAIVTSPRWRLRVDAAFATAAEPLFEPRPPAPPSSPTTTTASPR
jgi:hypothetical protein